MAVFEDGSGENRRKDPALDETPTAILVPGLTSDANDAVWPGILIVCHLIFGTLLLRISMGYPIFLM
jgi:hypothetical protein